MTRDPAGEAVVSSRYHGQSRPAFSRLHLDPDLLWVTPFPVRYIVGVVGHRQSGKSTVVSYLAEKKGFEAYSLSTLVREEAERRGLPLGRRDVLQDLGDELRAEHRPPGRRDAPYGDGGYLARGLLRRIHHRYHSHHTGRPRAPRIVIAGFKHPAELELLSGMDQFHLLVVEAPEQVRASRAARSEVLARELAAQGLDQEAAEVDAASSERRLELFRTHLESRDADGRDANPWAGDCAQAVGRLTELAEGLAAVDPQDEMSGPPDAGRLCNNGDVSLDDLFQELDLQVARFDRRYRSASVM